MKNMIYRLFVTGFLLSASLTSIAKDGISTTAINIHNPLDKKEVNDVISKHLVLPKNLIEKNEGLVLRLAINKEGNVAVSEVVYGQNKALVEYVQTILNRLKFRYVILNEENEEFMYYNLVLKFKK